MSRSRFTTQSVNALTTHVTCWHPPPATYVLKLPLRRLRAHIYCSGQTTCTLTFTARVAQSLGACGKQVFLHLLYQSQNLTKYFFFAIYYIINFIWVIIFPITLPVVSNTYISVIYTIFDNSKSHDSRLCSIRRSVFFMYYAKFLHHWNLHWFACINFLFQLRTCGHEGPFCTTINCTHPPTCRHTSHDMQV